MIEDFIKELKKKFQDRLMPTGHKEITEFVQSIYNEVNNGATKRCVQIAATKFIRSIKPDISDRELIIGIAMIESIVQTTFCELVYEGVLTKTESEDKIVMHWEKKRVLKNLKGMGGD